MRFYREAWVKDLTKDAVLAAVRSRRRGRRIRAFGALGLATLAAISLLSPNRDGSLAPGEVAEDTTEKVEVISDQQLLTLLSDQSPFLVRDREGNQQLILVNPRDAGGLRIVQ